MEDDQFTKLFTYMERRFNEAEERFTAIDRRFDQIAAVIDQLLKGQEVQEQERLFMNRQLDRHEQWIEQAAAELDFRYDR